MGLGFKEFNIMSHKSGKRNVGMAYQASTHGLDAYMKARKSGGTQTMNFYEDPCLFKQKTSGDIDNYKKEQ